LNVTQDKDKIGAIERKYFSSQTTCEDLSTTISSHSSSLGLDSFGGLFLISGITSMVSLLVYVFKFFYSHWPALSHNNTANSFWSKLVGMAKSFDQRDLSSHTFKSKESSVHDSLHSHSRNSIEGSDDVVKHNDNKSFSSRHGGKSIQGVPNSS
jgi:ionotropic glutamate receptor